MSYHDLSSCTLDAGERRDEARRIFDMICDYMENMTPSERKFVESMGDDFAPVSIKQLFWLRDIKDKYL